jgi:hypothetical protein
MKTRKLTAYQCAMTLVASAAVIAGCDSGSGGTAGSFQASSQNASQGHIRPLSIMTTTVNIVNNNTEAVSYVAPAVPFPCWTVSPSPPPSIAPSGGVSGVITESYNTGCSSNTPTMNIQYTAGPFNCNFYTNYVAGVGGGGTFSYSASGYDNNCYATPAPPGSGYNEQFTYGFLFDNGRKGHK